MLSILGKSFVAAAGWGRLPGSSLLPTSVQRKEARDLMRVDAQVPPQYSPVIFLAVHIILHTHVRVIECMHMKVSSRTHLACNVALPPGMSASRLKNSVLAVAANTEQSYRCLYLFCLAMRELVLAR
jgi:hypothetical protein